MRIGSHDAWGRPIDLAATLDGGQTFTWWPLPTGPCRRGGGPGMAWAYEGTVGPYRVRLQLDPALPPGTLQAEPPDPPGARAAIERLLDLSRNYRALDEVLVQRDPLLAPAVHATPGVRVVRLAPWEALVSFILSSHTHIARIKLMVRRLREAFSEDGTSFPSPQALEAAGEDALRQLGLGYRARYLHRVARVVARNPGLLGHWEQLPTAEARSALMELPGVGRKVADCVLLFGYGRWDAFPIDRWVRRALESVYFGGQQVPMGRLQHFAGERFGDLAALAQVHLFARARLGGYPGRGRRARGSDPARAGSRPAGC